MLYLHNVITASDRHYGINNKYSIILIHISEIDTFQLAADPQMRGELQRIASSKKKKSSKIISLDYIERKLLYFHPKTDLYVSNIQKHQFKNSQ